MMPSGCCVKRSICFVCHEAYPLLNPAYGGLRHGGSGVQMALLARAFERRGFEAHIVVLDHGQPDGECIDGVRVWKTYKPESGIPVFRFVHPRSTGLLRALAKADCEVYVQTCAGAATGLVAWFCTLRNRRFVYRVAHDTDCERGQQLIRLHRDRKLYEYGLRRADLILAQSSKQQHLLRDNYGLESRLIRMPVESADPLPTTKRDIDVLWVANVRPVKRPERVLTLARSLPLLRFRMVGGKGTGQDEFFVALRQEAASIDNLTWMGFQPYHETAALFPRARVFLSTSAAEGFPNTYLQAWMAGTPVVAFFDPDGIIERKGLGFVVSSEEEARWAIEKLVTDQDLWQSLSVHVRRHAEAHHGGSVIDDYEALMAPLFAG